MINYLSLEQIIRLHDSVIQEFGGLSGIRDYNLLFSCIESPKMAMFGDDLYPSFYDKASVYLFNIICNHPFNDGNKRTGAGSALLFLRINKIQIRCDLSPKNKVYENFLVNVARGKITKEQASYFLEHGKKLSLN